MKPRLHTKDLNEALQLAMDYMSVPHMRAERRRLVAILQRVKNAADSVVAAVLTHETITEGLDHKTHQER